MKKYIIVVIAVILVFTLLIPTACADKDEAENRFLELLGLMPSFLVDTEKPIYLIDYAAFRKDNDISFSNREDYIDTMIEDPVGNRLLVAGTDITGNGIYALTNTIQDKYVGYNLTDVDAEIHVDSIMYFVAAIGRFNPRATEDVFSNQDEWPSWAKDSYATEEYNGITLHSWGNAFDMHITTRLVPPHVDNLGRARPLAISERYLFSAVGLDELKCMIDVSQNRSCSLPEVSLLLFTSLAEVPELATVANEMADLGVYALIMGHHILAIGNPVRVMMDTGPKLKKFVVFGTGVGRDERGIYTALVLVHESSGSAAENVSLLEKRIAETDSVHYEMPWSEIITDTEISAEGNILLAKLYVRSQTEFWIAWLLTKDTLLFHEYE